jgi:hypothetical protein
VKSGGAGIVYANIGLESAAENHDIALKRNGDGQQLALRETSAGRRSPEPVLIAEL